MYPTPEKNYKLICHKAPYTQKNFKVICQDVPYFPKKNSK